MRGTGIGAGVAVAVVVLVACGPPPEAHYASRPDDVAAWTSAKLIELETHEKFSTMQREVRELSDGSTMWTFPECRKGAVHCRSSAVAITESVAVGGSTCEGANDTCCFHQFIIRDGVVQKYMPRGPRYECRSNCRTRPASVQAGCH